MQKAVLTHRVRRAASMSVIVLVACKAPQSTAVSDPAQTRATLRTADSLLQVAIESSDAERTAALYAEDAVLMPVAESIVEGRSAIRAEWQHVFGIPGYASRSRLIAAEPSIAGDLGYTRGTYESPMLGPKGEPLLERGKWVSIWRRQADGQWRIVVDIFNTDTPPPIHAPSTVSPSQP